MTFGNAQPEPLAAAGRLTTFGSVLAARNAAESG